LAEQHRLELARRGAGKLPPVAILAGDSRDTFHLGKSWLTASDSRLHQCFVDLYRL
jgi:hypothetical protein